VIDSIGNGKGFTALSEIQISQDCEMLGSDTAFGPLNSFLDQKGYLKTPTSQAITFHCLIPSLKQ